MTELLRKMLGFQNPANRERTGPVPVLVAGKPVMMTAPQARRYEELRQEEPSCKSRRSRLVQTP